MAQQHYSKDPLVSVIIPCYNYGKYLGEAVESVFRQTYKNIEITIIDDGSTDDTKNTVKELKKKYKTLKYIYQNHQGIIKTRNKALKQATGKYTIQLDADDKIETNYVEEVVKVAEKYNVDIVYTNVKKFGLDTSQTDFPEFSLEYLKNTNFIHMSSLLRTKSIKDFSFDNGLAGMTHEDWDFFLGLALHKRKAKLCKTTKLLYRIHGKGRNNILEDENDRLKYINVYRYVFEKYRKIFPEEFNYMIGNYFGAWYEYLHESNKSRIDSLSDQNKYLTNENLELKKHLNSILKSKKYKFGQAVSEVIHPKILRRIHRKIVK